MRLIAVISALIVLTVPASHGRPIRMWSYDDLAKESDVVMIVSVTAASKRTGAQEDFHGQSLDSVLTKFKVHAVLKGKYDSAAWNLHHITYPRDIRAIVNGWNFQSFGKADEFFLVFLKRAGADALVPVTGQEDLDQSFISLPPDMATRIKTGVQPSGRATTQQPAAGARKSP